LQRLYGLDALRGIAALAVALHHLAVINGLPVPPISASLAVDLFFILSGFVMTRTYEARLQADLGTGRFVLLRIRRLFGAMAAGASLGVLWAGARFGYSWDLIPAFALILAFLPALWMANCYLLNGPTWSLFFEIVANALHGGLFARLGTGTLIVLWLVCAAAGAVFFLAGLSEWGPTFSDILTLFPRMIGSYLLGIILHRRFGDRPLGSMPLAALASFAMLLVVATTAPIIELLAVLVAAPLILRASLGLDGRWRAIATWTGALSFPLYAVHQPVMRLAVLYGLPPISGLAVSVAAALAILLCSQEHSSFARPARAAAGA
jgi:peptidoglycan/LPS O-acetylase OafA/YrhL